MEICGREIRTRGAMVRIAFVDGEGYQFLHSPEVALGEFAKSGARADLFTFIQKLSDTSPQYHYSMEWDNFAALRVSTFENWLKHQIDFKVRNKVRKAEKNGVVVREVPFDQTLITGVHAIYNESPVRQGKRFWHYGKDLES